jgi:hypothetical protein
MPGVLPGEKKSELCCLPGGFESIIFCKFYSANIQDLADIHKQNVICFIDR